MDHDNITDTSDLLGHNSTGEELRQLIERAERLEEEKKGIAEDIKDVFSEAKARGFDTKAMRECIKIRKKKREDFEHEQAILETYLAHLGLI